jgi:hypothetical protein
MSYRLTFYFQRVVVTLNSIGMKDIILPQGSSDKEGGPTLGDHPQNVSHFALKTLFSKFS